MAVRAVAFELDPVSFRSTRKISRAGGFAFMPFVPPCCCPECSRRCKIVGEYRVTEENWTVLLTPFGDEVARLPRMLLSARA